MSQIVSKYIERILDIYQYQDLKELKSIYDYIRMLDADGYPNAFIENDYFKFEFFNASLKKNEEINAEVRIIKK